MWCSCVTIIDIVSSNHIVIVFVIIIIIFVLCLRSIKHNYKHHHPQKQLTINPFCPVVFVSFTAIANCLLSNDGFDNEYICTEQ